MFTDLIKKSGISTTNLNSKKLPQKMSNFNYSFQSLFFLTLLKMLVKI